MTDALLSALIKVEPALSAFRAQLECAHVDDTVSVDIDAMLFSFGLQKIRRYYSQTYWSEETYLAANADQIEPDLKLENVAAHSWHVADAALLLVNRFNSLDILRVLKLCILHDKLEIYTGDFDPVGSGRGEERHVFNDIARHGKINEELEALKIYASTIRDSVRADQVDIIKDSIFADSSESRFVKAVDKLQALSYVHEKKNGALLDDHIFFSIRYSSQSVILFPGLSSHYVCLLQRFLHRIACKRRATVASVIDAALGCLTR